MPNNSAGSYPPRDLLRKSAVSAVAALLLIACSDLLTSAPEAGDVFDGPVDGLTSVELAAFVRGDGEFGRRFAPATGLGPIFNDVSCAACHSGDGRGRPGNALTRIGSPDDDMYRSLGGPQIQDRAIAGALAEVTPTGVPISLRLPPPVFGSGLIESIPESEILSRADPNDADGDGISGRPNWVTPPAWVPASEPGGGTTARIGRFGRKGQTTSILQQTVEAYLQDMGITTTFLSVENRNPLAGHPHDAADLVPEPEAASGTVFAVVNYLRLLAPPAPAAPNAIRDQGAVLFADVGCTSCHVPTLQTGTVAVAALSNRPVTLYSDLLLHDMGDALADHRPDQGATGREWRTTPLWGLRLIRQFLNGEAFLLHDGRASTIEEAILLHGGEGQHSRDRFNALNPADRAALIEFVGSR